jgi:putative ABC transport system permease protein
MALGAQRSQVAWLFLRRTLKHVTTGLAIGMIGALGVGFALQGLLVDVRANEPLVLASIAGFVLLVAALASVLPARRAARLDPVAALRRN